MRKVVIKVPEKDCWKCFGRTLNMNLHRDRACNYCMVFKKELKTIHVTKMNEIKPCKECKQATIKPSQ